MPVADRTYVTEAEFLALPDTGERVELFDGEVVVSPSASLRHQHVARELFLVLHAWARGRPEGLEVYFAPLDVRFGPDRILQPDLVVFDGAPDLTSRGPVTRLPVATVEVLSPSNVDYDRFAKRLAYAAAGVRAYLVVDPDAGVVEVFTGPGLKARALCRERLVVDGLPGLDAELGPVFG